MQYSAPQIVRDVDQLRRIMRGWRSTGSTIALAPIMSRLHDGQLSLIETARRHAARVVVSVSNPPDIAQATLLDRAACDLIFAPDPMPETTQVILRDAGLEDAASINAMVTAMARLLNQVQPDIAVFGEKDWQQLVSIRQMVRDLALPVGVVSSATLRDEDGLALSARNRALGPEDRAIAARLNKALSASADLIAQNGPVEQIVSACNRFLSESGFEQVHYVAARRAHDLAPITGFDRAKPSRLLAAVQLGGVRLSDNVAIARTMSQN